MNVTIMKRIIEIKRVGENQIVIRLEATKRRRIWMRIRRGKFVIESCNEFICPLYKNCFSLSSPLKKYPNFGFFCNNLFSDYPDLKTRLEKFGVKDINQVVPIKKPR